MDARTTQAELAGLAPFATTHDAAAVQEIRLAAARNRDQAIAEGIVRGFTALFAPLSRMLARARVERELRSLTDRELADIGLTRGEIATVLAAKPPAEERRKIVVFGGYARAA